MFDETWKPHYLLPNTSCYYIGNLGKENIILYNHLKVITMNKHIFIYNVYKKCN